MFFLAHAAVDFYGDYYGFQGSQESLYSVNSSHRMFTPPAVKPKKNVFFNSDDNLYKRETRKLTIPRIEIDYDEPIFNLQVTDFSEPSPKNVVLSYDETGTSFEKIDEMDLIEPKITKSWKEKANSFVQRKSYSIEIHENPSVDIEQISDKDKFLSIGSKKYRQQKMSASLQDLSSSTSSINSIIHDSNLDLSHIDPDTPIKHKNWKSPDEVRLGQTDGMSKTYENKATSFPELNKRESFGIRSKSVSEEKLGDKLTEYERLEVLKLLHDWSLNGSDSKCDFNLKLVKTRQFPENYDVKPNLRVVGVRFCSEPNLLPIKTSKIPKNEVDFDINQTVRKSKSSPDIDLMHKCNFRNCIFNEAFVDPKRTNMEDLISIRPKSILKNSKERLQETECLNNITNLKLQQQKTPKLLPNSRRFSEVMIAPKSFNSQLVRCDSLERLTTHLQKKTVQHKKFPESYIVTRKNTNKNKTRNNETINRSPKRSPKILLLQNKYLPKTWKSCSDIKNKKTVRKCCRFAKKNCPILENYCDNISRKTQSCADIEQDYAARLAALEDNLDGAFPCKIT